MKPRRWAMSRRRFVGTVGSGLGGALLSRPFAAEADGGAAPPNLLIVQPDQHRGTVMGCAGDADARTPHLDRLAAEGIRFTNCASASPVCSPFRGSFQTGLYPFRHGVVANNIRMSPRLRTFAEIFAERGYATGYIGKWHLDGGWPPEGCGGWIPPERRQGWQQWHGYEKAHQFVDVWQFDDQHRKVPVDGYDWEPAWHTDTALGFIRRQTAAGRPWVYYVAYGPPHLPRECPEEWLARFPSESFTLPADVRDQLPAERHDELRRELQVYYAQVAAVDHEVGRLMAGLAELGIAGNTIVLYTSDHGDVLGSHAGAKGRLRGKGVPYQSAFRIPLIVRWPGHIAAGRVCDELVSSVDLAPTVLELAGLPAPASMQGMSKADWCLKGSGRRRDMVYLGLGWNKPIPPEAFREYSQLLQSVPDGMRLVVDRQFPAGRGIGQNPTYRDNSGNWDCGYDETITVPLTPGRRRVTVRQVGRGRMEVQYLLRDYVDGHPEFALPVSSTFTFAMPPEDRFAVDPDGHVRPADVLRGHLYGSANRMRPPTFELDCRRPAVFAVRVTKSVGDREKCLQILVDDGAGVPAVESVHEPRYRGWWRAVWDGRYVYRPGSSGGWLYDHRTDPLETRNLVDSPELADVRRRLGKNLLALAAETGDPVLPELREMLAEKGG